MSKGIELHDSMLAKVEFRDGAAFVSLSPAYVHHAGSGWHQDGTVTIRGATPFASLVDLPAPIWEGSLRVEDTCHSNLIPLTGTFEGAVRFSITLVRGDTFTIEGDHATIELLGQRRFIEKIP